MERNDALKTRVEELSPLVVCPNDSLLKELRTLWPPIGSGRDLPGFHLSAYPHPEDITTLLDLHKPNLCVLDGMTQSAHALAILQSAVKSHPQIPVISVHGSTDSEAILRFIRQGAADFLVYPVQSDQLNTVLDKLLGAKPVATPTRHAELCAVIPAKGACGASTLAASLAWTWKRRGAKDLLLADLDPLTGSLAFLLKLKPSWSFVDALVRGQDLDADVWGGLVYPTQGVDVLLAPEKPDPGLEDLGSAVPLMRFARSIYDHIVVDVGRAHGSWPLSIARESDHVVLVVTPELPSIHAGQRILTLWRQHAIDLRKIRLVVNRYQKGVGLSPERIEETLQMQVTQLVPADFACVNEALMAGEAVAGNSGIGKALTSLVDKLQGGPPEKSAAKPEAGLLGRWFKSFSHR